jgi:uncharacterized membrane protein
MRSLKLPTVFSPWLLPPLAFCLTSFVVASISKGGDYIVAEEKKEAEEQEEVKEEPKEKTKEEPKEAAPSSSGEVNFMALLAYLGPLALIPLLTEKKDEFVKYHVKQGMVLLIAEAAIWIIFWFLFGSITYSWSTMSLWSMISMIQNALYFGIGILSILGVVNVLNGEKKELPVVGKYAEKITFVK